ncbi:MAG: lytic transglycosylase domain-containing protein, partial [Zetaproteobacteria bacterium]
MGAGAAAGLVWLGSYPRPQPHARPEPAAANPLPEKPRTASGIAQVFAQPPAPEPADYERLVIVADLENIVRERSPAPERAHEIAEAIYRHARRYGLDPYLVLAVAEVESGLDPFAVSVAGARGLMQVMP